MTGTRRQRGAGSVYKDERGRWVAQMYVNGKPRRKTAGSKIDATTALSLMIADHERGVAHVDGNALVQPHLDRWEERVLPFKRTGKPKHPLSTKQRQAYEGALRVLAAEFGRERIATLNRRRIEDGFDRIQTGVYGRGQPLRERQMKTFRHTFIQVLDQIDELPNFAKRSSIKFADGKRPPEALSGADALTLWTGLTGHRLEAMFKLAITCATRPGEAAAVCWDSINLDTGELTLQRGVPLTDDGYRLMRQMKTPSAFRSLIIPQPALDAIRVQSTKVKVMKLRAAKWTDHDLMTPTPTGGPWDPSNVRDELTDLCAAIGIRRVLPDELRHTAKWLLDDAGVDPLVIRNLMGHSNEWMQDQYGNRARRAEAGHVAVMEAMFGSL